MQEQAGGIGHIKFAIEVIQPGEHGKSVAQKSTLHPGLIKLCCIGIHFNIVYAVPLWRPLGRPPWLLRPYRKKVVSCQPSIFSPSSVSFRSRLLRLLVPRFKPPDTVSMTSALYMAAKSTALVSDEFGSSPCLMSAAWHRLVPNSSNARCTLSIIFSMIISWVLDGLKLLRSIL